MRSINLRERFAYKKWPKWAVRTKMTDEEWMLMWTQEAGLGKNSTRDLSLRNERFYEQYINSRKWLVRRAFVLFMSERRCADCGARASHVHHVTYRRLGKELLDDLVPLCSACHDGRHSKKQRV